jgi:hypothetical protein
VKVVTFSLLSLTLDNVLLAQTVTPARPAAGEKSAAGGVVQRPTSATVGATNTVAAVAFQNYDDLARDVSFLGALIGQPNLGDGIEVSLAQLTGGKGLAGLDKTKPWGFIVQSDGMQFLPLVCLPVTNADDLLATIAAANGTEVNDDGTGIQRLALPNGETALVKAERGWLFGARNPASLSRLPKDPQAAFSRILGRYDIAAHAEAQNVPPMYREIAVAAIQSAMQGQLQRQATESDDEYAQRQQALQAQMDQTVQQIRELDSLTLGVTVDEPQERGLIEFTYMCVPDGKLAKQLAAFGGSRTNFAGFYQADAAATVCVASKADPEVVGADLAQMQTMIAGARTQFNKAVDENADIPDEAARDAIKAAADQWFGALEETIKAGEMDAGAALRLNEDSLTLVAGALVQDSAKFENGLKKLDEGLQKSPEFPGIQWNAAAHDGVNFHTLTLPVPQTEDGPGKLLGGQVGIAFGIGPRSIYLAVGKDNLDAVKQAIDVSKAEPGRQVSPFEMALSLEPIMQMTADQAGEEAQRAQAQAIADMLRNEAIGRDHLRLVAQLVPNGIKYRVEAEEGALRAIAQAALAARAQAAVQEDAGFEEEF